MAVVTDEDALLIWTGESLVPCDDEGSAGLPLFGSDVLPAQECQLEIWQLDDDSVVAVCAPFQGQREYSVKLSAVEWKALGYQPLAITSPRENATACLDLSGSLRIISGSLRVEAARALIFHNGSIELATTAGGTSNMTVAATVYMWDATPPAMAAAAAAAAATSETKGQRSFTREKWSAILVKAEFFAEGEIEESIVRVLRIRAPQIHSMFEQKQGGGVRGLHPQTYDESDYPSTAENTKELCAAILKNLVVVSVGASGVGRDSSLCLRNPPIVVDTMEAPPPAAAVVAAATATTTKPQRRPPKWQVPLGKTSAAYAPPPLEVVEALLRDHRDHGTPQQRSPAGSAAASCWQRKQAQTQEQRGGKKKKNEKNQNQRENDGRSAWDMSTDTGPCRSTPRCGSGGGGDDSRGVGMHGATPTTRVARPQTISFLRRELRGLQKWESDAAATIAADTDIAAGGGGLCVSVRSQQMQSCERLSGGLILGGGITRKPFNEIVTQQEQATEERGGEGGEDGWGKEDGCGFGKASSTHHRPRSASSVLRQLGRQKKQQRPRSASPPTLFYSGQGVKSLGATAKNWDAHTKVTAAAAAAATLAAQVDTQAATAANTEKGHKGVDFSSTAMARTITDLSRGAAADYNDKGDLPHQIHQRERDVAFNGGRRSSSSDGESSDTGSDKSTPRTGRQSSMLLVPLDQLPPPIPHAPPPSSSSTTSVLGTTTTAHRDPRLLKSSMKGGRTSDSDHHHRGSGKQRPRSAPASTAARGKRQPNTRVGSGCGLVVKPVPDPVRSSSEAKTAAPKRRTVLKSMHRHSNPLFYPGVAAADDDDDQKHHSRVPVSNQPARAEGKGALDYKEVGGAQSVAERGGRAAATGGEEWEGGERHWRKDTDKMVASHGDADLGAVAGDADAGDADAEEDWFGAALRMATGDDDDDEGTSDYGNSSGDGRLVPGQQQQQGQGQPFLGRRRKSSKKANKAAMAGQRSAMALHIGLHCGSAAVSAKPKKAAAAAAATITTAATALVLTPILAMAADNDLAKRVGSEAAPLSVLLSSPPPLPPSSSSSSSSSSFHVASPEETASFAAAGYYGRRRPHGRLGQVDLLLEDSGTAIKGKGPDFWTASTTATAATSPLRGRLPRDYDKRLVGFGGSAPQTGQGAAGDCGFVEAARRSHERSVDVSSAAPSPLLPLSLQDKVKVVLRSRKVSEVKGEIYHRQRHAVNVRQNQWR